MNPMDARFYRAKEINHPKDWIEGVLVLFRGDPYIIEEDTLCGGFGNYLELEAIGVRVVPETLCRCTGMMDKNQRLIWENDIVRVVQDGSEYVYQIVWDATETDFKATNGKENYGRHFAYLSCCEEVEVIGNAFDNPEYVAKLGPTYSEYEEEDMSFLDYDEKE